MRNLRSVVMASVAVVVSLSLGCAVELPSAPKLHQQAGPSPWAGVDQSLLKPEMEILYATDRQPETVDGKATYGFGRSASLAFGSAVVEMGEGLTWEEVAKASVGGEREGSYELRLGAVRELGRFPASGAPPELVGGKMREPAEKVQAENTATKQLHAELARRLALTPRKEVVVFIHGYNNRFENAAFRTAQLWHYLGRQFVPILYSWPSGSDLGLLRGYTHDRESGEFTIYHLRKFLLSVAASPEVARIHIVAHSRGTDVLVTALRELKLSQGDDAQVAREKLKIGQVVLAAPDLDWEVSQQRITSDRVPFMSQRFTVYASPTDKAIAIADWLFASRRRVGQLEVDDLSEAQRAALREFSQLDVVRVTRKTDGTGHSYFISDPLVLSDLILLLRDGRAPGPENGRPLRLAEGGVWELGNDYLSTPTTPSKPK